MLPPAPMGADAVPGAPGGPGTQHRASARRQSKAIALPRPQKCSRTEQTGNPVPFPGWQVTGNWIWGSPQHPGGHPPGPAILYTATTASLCSRNGVIFSQKEENPSKHFSAFRSRDPRCQANPKQTLVQIITRNGGFYGGLVHGAVKGFMLLISIDEGEGKRGKRNKMTTTTWFLSLPCTPAALASPRRGDALPRRGKVESLNDPATDSPCPHQGGHPTVTKVVTGTWPTVPCTASDGQLPGGTLNVQPRLSSSTSPAPPSSNCAIQHPSCPSPRSTGSLPPPSG